MSPEEILSQLGDENLRLAHLGVDMSISLIEYGARNYGHNYEYVRYKEDDIKPTAINCFMALLHS